MSKKNSEWDSIISSNSKIWRVDLAEIWLYRDLIRSLVHKDIVIYYKQTLLGPLWFLLQPLLTSLIFVVIFGQVANISTEGFPKILFYLTGTIIWFYFSDSLVKISNTYKENRALFNKIYFPKIVIPISIIVSNLLKLAIQLLLFYAVIYYYNFNYVGLNLLSYLTTLTVIIIITASLSLGAGLIITSFASKYRDLLMLMQFGLQLLMYATPIIYPLSAVPDRYTLIKTVISYNPLTPVVESFRYMLLNPSQMEIGSMLYSLIFSLVLLSVGIIIFRRIEKNAMDNV